MRVEVQKWGNSAAVRVPALALKDAGIQVGQCHELRVEEGRLAMEPANESLGDFLARIAAKFASVTTQCALDVGAKLRLLLP